MTNSQPYYSVAEAAKIAKCSTNKIRCLIRAGKIEAVNTSSGTRAIYRLPGDEIKRFFPWATFEKDEPK
jgi:excisionase family DNA binding protein